MLLVFSYYDVFSKSNIKCSFIDNTSPPSEGCPKGGVATIVLLTEYVIGGAIEALAYVLDSRIPVPCHCECNAVERGNLG